MRARNAQRWENSINEKRSSCAAQLGSQLLGNEKWIRNKTFTLAGDYLIVINSCNYSLRRGVGLNRCDVSSAMEKDTQLTIYIYIPFCQGSFLTKYRTDFTNHKVRVIARPFRRRTTATPIDESGNMSLNFNTAIINAHWACIPLN